MCCDCAHIECFCVFFFVSNVDERFRSLANVDEYLANVDNVVQILANVCGFWRTGANTLHAC